MEIFCTQGKIDRAPASETCIQWEMKFGLYKLSRPKAAADDWIWLADHVVSKGAYKCLVIDHGSSNEYSLTEKRSDTLS
jgi:hypothetical protein